MKTLKRLRSQCRDQTQLTSVIVLARADVGKLRRLHRVHIFLTGRIHRKIFHINKQQKNFNDSLAIRRLHLLLENNAANW